jgi:predicted secreted protein
MSMQKGSGLVFKIGDGGEPETFSDLASARIVALAVGNGLPDVSSLAGGGMPELKAEAGVQHMEISVQGLFSERAAEEALRAMALDRTARNCRICFPNGDVYAAAFVVRDYARAGRHDDLETFSATLARTGGGVFTRGS